MYIRSESIIKRKFKSLLLKIYNLIDNNNDTKFSRNGEESLLNFICSNHQNRKCVFFDVGSNVGAYTEKFIMLSDKYNIDFEAHVFEPMQKSFEILEKKFGNNHRVHLNKFAASSETGATKIYFDKEASTLASLYERDLDAYHIKLANFLEIPTKRLDEYLKEKNIEKIDFLKLDVEGHEVPVLNGLGGYLKPDYIPNIQFEYGGANIDSRTFLRDLFYLFNQNGYQVYKLKKGYLEKRVYDPHMENFIYSNYFASNRMS